MWIRTYRGTKEGNMDRNKLEKSEYERCGDTKTLREIRENELITLMQNLNSDGKDYLYNY